MAITTFTFKGEKIELVFSALGRPRTGESFNEAYKRREKAARHAYRKAH